MQGRVVALESFASKRLGQGVSLVRLAADFEQDDVAVVNTLVDKALADREVLALLAELPNVRASIKHHSSIVHIEWCWSSQKKSKFTEQAALVHNVFGCNGAEVSFGVERGRAD